MIARALAGFINFFLAIAEIFLGLRIILRFFAANPTVHFVHWVYTSSSVLLEPFRGIFATEVIGRNHVVDFSALFAMMVYGLLALAFSSLVVWLNPARYAVVKTSKKQL